VGQPLSLAEVAEAELEEAEEAVVVEGSPAAEEEGEGELLPGREDQWERTVRVFAAVIREATAVTVIDRCRHPDGTRFMAAEQFHHEPITIRKCPGHRARFTRRLTVIEPDRVRGVQ
jgi:hypothetical protein